MRTVIFCFSDNGCLLAAKLCGLLGADNTAVQTTEKFAGKYGFTPHKSVCGDVGALFAENELLIFICACGIAVRAIAPYLKNKTVDPAVLCIDDMGKFVIPILSGHIGGANDAARKIAALLGSAPVITTATDINGRFSCDEWAAEHGCAISSLKIAKEVSAAILTGEIAIDSEFPLSGNLPEGLKIAKSGDVGIYIGIKNAEPFAKTLRLIPKITTLGIGCRRGITSENIASAVRAAFEKNGIDASSIARICSIDVKRDEDGLLEYAGALKIMPEFYSAAELKAVEGEFSDSEFVKKTVGVGNVCERAACVSGGELIIRKTSSDGVTVAAAVKDWSVSL